MIFSRCIPVVFLCVYISAHLNNHLANGKSTSKEQLSRFKLYGKSFSIRSSISKITPEGLKQQIRVFERYSADQRRARLDFDSLNENLHSATESFYYDARTNSGLFSYPESRRCGSGSRAELDEYLFGKVPMYELENIVDDDIDLGHIIGPARLLFLIASQANQMTANERTDLKIRNIPVVEFHLEVPEMNDGGKVLFDVFYDRSIFHHESLEISVPIYIGIWFSKPSTGYVIDFYSPQISTSNLARSSPSNSFTKRQLDEFAYPVSQNCSKHLRSVSIGDLFERYDISAITFSFRSISYLSYWNFEHFVAFNGFIQTLRIDSRRVTRKDSENAHDSFALVDLRTNRRYTMFENKASQVQVDEGLLSEVEENSCVVTQAFETEAAKRAKTLNLANLILGAREFVFMGKAQVRGMDAKVYESSSANLPFWIGESFVYQSRSKRFGTRERFARLYKTNGPADREYSVVVYIADKSDEQSTGLNLLLIEVYGLNHKNGDTVLLSQIHDFIWDLNESPNGDPVQELFSHKQLCSATGGNRHAEVSILLEEDEPDNSVGQKDLGWLRDWPARTRALVSSIRDVMDVQAVMMYDVESQLHMNTKTNIRSIAASFRVAEPPQVIHNIEFMGNARMRGRSNGVPMTAFTFTECLWMVGHRSYPIYVLFNENLKTCLLDHRLVESPSLSLENSTSFVFGDYSGEVFKIWPEKDNEVSLRGSWLRDKKFSHLEGRAMILQNVLHEDVSRPIDSNDLKVRIKSIKMRHINFMSDGADLAVNNSSPPEAAYAGFGLSPRLGENSKLIVKPKESDKNEDNEDLDVTRAQCEAACLGDPTCRVYSYCVRRGMAECITSGANFAKSSIGEQLDSASVAELKSGSTFNVQLVSEEVELIKDNRCELLNKIYMDSFIRDGTRKVWPGMFKIIPVSGEEECAEICFTDNLEIIRISAAKSEEIMRLVHKEGVDLKTETDQLKAYYKELQKKFCSSFNYLSSSLDQDQMEVLKRLSTGNVDGDAEPNGYCFIRREKQLQAAGSNINFYVRLDSYLFDFSTLFEKRSGINLLVSHFPQDVLSAYYVRAVRGKAEPEHLEMVANSVRDGKNFQLSFRGLKPAGCAMECFFQSSGLWPACRSFDTLVSWADDPTTDICQLNTVSMEEPNFNDSLIKHVELKTEMVAHYEPRFRPLRELIGNTFAIDNLLDRIVSKKYGTLTIGSFGMLLILVASLASGIMLGVHLAHYAIGRPEGRSGPALNTISLVDALELEQPQAQLDK